MPYDFTQEGFRQFSEAVIAAGGDQATLTTLLADMQTTYENSIGNLAKASEDIKITTEENERLRKANMDLFLRIGSDPGDKPAKQETEEPTAMDCTQYMAKYYEKEETK